MSQPSADLPKFEDGKTYVLTGKTLNQIMAAIRANSILQVDGMNIARTPDGIRLTRQQ